MKTCVRYIERKIRQQLNADLTTGRADNDLVEFSKEQRRVFLKTNSSRISNVANEMFNKLDTEEQTLQGIKQIPADWYRETLYDFFGENELFGDIPQGD